MKNFSIAADFRNTTLDEYNALNSQYSNSRVVETYGQISINNQYGSGRAGDLLPSVDYLKLKEYIRYSKLQGIKFNYTFNTTCMSNREFTQEGRKELCNFFYELKEAGVDSLTIALPSVIALICDEGLDFEIKASTICYIDNANKARAYKNMGADRIVVDESINRDFTKLKQIQTIYGSNAEVIVNVICHQDCIYETFHHNQTSHDIDDNKKSANFYSHRCMLQRCENPANLLKLAWIRPEDLRYYESIGITSFKIQGRQAVLSGDPVRTIKYYFDEYYDGNLMELLDLFSVTNSFIPPINNRLLDGFVEAFYKQNHLCKRCCDECNYCEKYAQKHLPIKEIEKIFGMAQEFYQGIDEYSKKSNNSMNRFNTKNSITL